MVPAAHRKRIFFTTNLCARLEDSTIEALSNSGIHHINISLDSLAPGTFAIMRKGGNYDRFMDNLERLVSKFSANPNSPKLHYLTLVCKLNLPELPALLRSVFERYLCSQIEFRPVWQLDHNAKWLKDKYITALEYERLNAELSATRLPFDIAQLYEPTWFMGKRNVVAIVPPFVSLRISADGTVDFAEREVRININDIHNPCGFFRDMLMFLSLDTARARMINQLQKSQCSLGIINRIFCQRINRIARLYKPSAKKHPHQI